MTPLHVLLVEDEPDLRLLVEDALSHRGIEVTVAKNGAEALERLRGSGGYSHVVTDVCMPEGVSGLQVANEALERHPSVQVIVVSGYQRSQLPPIPHTMSFLPKPYRMHQLFAALGAEGA